MLVTDTHADLVSTAELHITRAQVQEVRRITLLGLFVNLGLCVLKFAFGVIGGSQALIADAVHSLSDTSTDLAILIGVRYWSAPADADHPHGHGRIETLVSFFIGAVLAGVAIGLVYRALATLGGRHSFTPGWTVFAAACSCIVIKECLYWWTISVATRAKSSALAANAWHHRSDAFSSVPVAAAVLCGRLWPQWGFLDHVASVIVSVLVFQAAWRILEPAFRQLIDAGASETERRTITELVATVEGVEAVHAVRTRHIGPGLQVDLHVLVAPDISVREGHTIAGHVTERLRDDGPNVVDVLVHIEPYEAKKALAP
jgi:cation diffusion facilitator family transporter